MAKSLKRSVVYHSLKEEKWRSRDEYIINPQEKQLMHIADPSKP